MQQKETSTEYSTGLCSKVNAFMSVITRRIRVMGYTFGRLRDTALLANPLLKAHTRYTLYVAAVLGVLGAGLTGCVSWVLSKYTPLSYK